MSAPVRLTATAGDFFDQVRVLESRFPRASRVGTADDVRREPVRFKSSIGLGFPARDIESIEWSRKRLGEPRCDMVVTFLGLLGVVSPLPPPYTREAIEDEVTDREESVRAFLDLFHHRILSLYYRAWRKYRPHLYLDPEAKSAATRTMLALGGIDAETWSRAEPVGGGAKLREFLPLLGPLSRRVRSAHAAQQALTAFLGGAPVSVVAWVRRELPIPQQQRFTLGGSGRLGKDVVLGEKTSDSSCRCRIIVGPLPLETFLEVVPRGKVWDRLHEIVSACLPPGLEYELETRLSSDEVPSPLLDGSAQLARTTWLGEPLEDDLRNGFGSFDSYANGTVGAESRARTKNLFAQDLRRLQEEESNV